MTPAPTTILALEDHLAADFFGPGLLTELAESTDLRRVDPSDLAREPLDEVEILITGWSGPRLDSDLLGRMPRLRLVLHAGGSVRAIASDAFWRRGIPIVSAAAANNPPVADYVVAQIVLALKNVHRAATRMRVDREMPALGSAPGSFGQIVGLVSFGSVAREVRERLRAFDAEVAVWDPFLSNADAESSGVRLVSDLPDLFARSLVLSVHTPLIPGVTERMIRREHLDALPLGATFLNSARGAIVDEGELAEVLGRRADLFAILDVTDPEPPLQDSPLFDLDNVMLTGHSAGAVGSERRGIGRLLLAEARRFLAGEPLQHAVSEVEAATRA